MTPSTLRPSSLNSPNGNSQMERTTLQEEPESEKGLVNEYDDMMIGILNALLILSCAHLFLKLLEWFIKMSLKKVAYFYRLRHWNIVTGAQEMSVRRLPGKRGLTRLFTEVARNLSREYNGEAESVTRLLRRHCLAAIYRLFLSKDDRDQLNYMGLVVAASLGHIRAMKRYLDSGVKPTGPDGDIICMAPLLTAMRIGPGPTQLLLEYGALSSKEAKMLLDTDYIISSRMSVIKTLIAYGNIPSLSLPRLEEASRKVKGNNVEVLKKIENIKALLRQPLSLVSLARNVVADRLGAMPDRRGKLPSTGLPVIWQKELCTADRIDLSMVRTDDFTFQFTFVIMPCNICN